MQPRRSCLTPSLTGCTRQIAPRLKLSRNRPRLACGTLDSSSRACSEVAKSGFRRTIFIHAGVQLALAICANDTYSCPRGEILRHTTTDREGKRTYRSIPEQCRNCPCKTKCGANEKGQKVHTTHIWQEYLDLVEQIRKTERAKEIYTQRKETIERVFADAKEKHAMRYTHHRGLAAVTRWVRLKFAAMNLKKLAIWSWNDSSFSLIFSIFLQSATKTHAFPA